MAQPLQTGEEGIFPALEELVHNISLFWWLANHPHPRETYEDEEAVNLVATGYMAALHDALRATNYDEHALRELMTESSFAYSLTTRTSGTVGPFATISTSTRKKTASTSVRQSPTSFRF